MAFHSKLIDAIFRIFRYISSLKLRPVKGLAILLNWIRQCVPIYKNKPRPPRPPKGTPLPPNQHILYPSSAPRAEHVSLDILQGRGDDHDGPYTAPMNPPYSAGTSYLEVGRLHADSPVLRAGQLPAESPSYGSMSIEGADSGSRSAHGRPSTTRAPNASTAVSLSPILRQSQNGIMHPATSDSSYAPMAPAAVQRWHRRVDV